MKRDKSLSSVEILLVDDGSKDKTWDIIREWTKRFPDGDSLP